MSLRRTARIALGLALLAATALAALVAWLNVRGEEPLEQPLRAPCTTYRCRPPFTGWTAPTLSLPTSSPDKAAPGLSS